MIRRPPRSTRVRSSAASDVYKRQDLLAANASAMRLDPVKSVGVLIPGASVEATVPGTRSAMVHHPRVADSIVAAIETGERRYTDVPTVCDAGEAAVFEPLAGEFLLMIVWAIRMTSCFVYR